MSGQQQPCVLPFTCSHLPCLWVTIGLPESERLSSYLLCPCCSTGALLPPVFAGMGHPMQPMQQCLALNAYLTGLIGAVLPLFMLS